MNILVTGGAGYIGSHTVKELTSHGHLPVTYDNLSEGHQEALRGGTWVKGNLSDEEKLGETLEKYSIDAVMHFAAFCLVGESVTDPQKYYHNNVTQGLTLLKVMLEHNIKLFIFSSTAAVYGEPQEVPVTENYPLSPVNPYGQSKETFENILADYQRAYGLNYVSLRYFNASGADPDGKIGEDHDPETHLIPLVLKSALMAENHSLSSQQSSRILKIFGTDYPTPDGTCIRDYIHICDLARAHILALEALSNGMKSQVFNLGNGNGYSVKEVISLSKKITGREIPVIESPRRPGDPAVLVASSEKIKKELGWVPQFPELDRIIDSAWKWHKGHPNGFKK